MRHGAGQPFLITGVAPLRQRFQKRRRQILQQPPTVAMGAQRDAVEQRRMRPLSASRPEDYAMQSRHSRRSCIPPDRPTSARPSSWTKASARLGRSLIQELA